MDLQLFCFQNTKMKILLLITDFFIFLGWSLSWEFNVQLVIKFLMLLLLFRSKLIHQIENLLSSESLLEIQPPPLTSPVKYYTLCGTIFNDVNAVKVMLCPSHKILFTNYGPIGNTLVQCASKFDSGCADLKTDLLKLGMKSMYYFVCCFVLFVF